MSQSCAVSQQMSLDHHPIFGVLNVHLLLDHWIHLVGVQTLHHTGTRATEQFLLRRTGHRAHQGSDLQARFSAAMPMVV